jgi:hypothetical protein
MPPWRAQVPASIEVRGSIRGEVCEEIELSKVLKIHRSRHAITSEQLAARGVKTR